MADCIDSRQDGSDTFYDPFCEPCCELKGFFIEVYGYCDECYQYLCSDCHATHSKLQTTKGHVIKRGADMPQSMAAKPVRYNPCDIHPGLVKDLFCSEHKHLICSSCSSAEHRACFVSSVVDACKTTNASELRYLCDAINEIYNNVKSVSSLVDRNITRLKEQRRSLLQEAVSLYDRAVSKLNAKHEETTCEIETKYKTQLQTLDAHKDKITPLSSKMAESLKNARVLCRTANAVDARVFIKSQELVESVNQCLRDLQCLNQSLTFVSLTLRPGDLISNFLAQGSSFGSLFIDKKENAPSMPASDIVFPVAHVKAPTTVQVDCNEGMGETLIDSVTSVDEGIAIGNNSTNDFDGVGMELSNMQVPVTEGEKQQAELGKTTTAFQSSITSIKLANAEAHVAAFDGKLQDDNVVCNITGMAILCDGRCVIVDNENGKVKMFSQCKAIRRRFQERQYLGCVKIPSKPRDIVVINKEAVVTTDNKDALVIFDISSRVLSYSSLKETVKLPFKARGIAKYKDKLVVTCPRDNPPCVKLIDKTGKVYWSASSDHLRMFYRPWYVCSGSVETSSIYVTDWDNSILLLNGETGEVTMKQKKNKKGPTGIATDAHGNIYVCYRSKNEICQLQGDLSEGRKLLSFQDGLRDAPQAIAYDDVANVLMISYNSANSVDCIALDTPEFHTVKEAEQASKQSATTQSQSQYPPRQPGRMKKAFQFADAFVKCRCLSLEFTSSTNVANLFHDAPCNITGTTVANDGRSIIVDNENGIVQLLSRSKREGWLRFLHVSLITREKMEKMGFLVLHEKPRDIAMINDHEAAITTDNSSLVIIDINNKLLSHVGMAVTKTVKLSFNAYGIAKYRNDKVLVTCLGNQLACVKLIDVTGRVYWSTSVDEQGKQLFSNHLYVCCHIAESCSSVFVSDATDNRIIKLNGETGGLIMTRESKKREPRGITTDTDGNIYICYSGSHEILVSRDDLPTFFEHSVPEPGFKPQAIAFDRRANGFIVSYNGADCVEVLKLRSFKIVFFCCLVESFLILSMLVKFLFETFSSTNG